MASTVNQLLGSDQDRIIESVCFAQELHVIDTLTNQQIGHLKIDIGPTKFKDALCYFVSAVREIKKPGSNGTYLWTVSAYVNTQLETLNESVYDVFSEGEDAISERITETVISEDPESSEGNYVTISESSTGNEDAEGIKTYLYRNHEQLIMNGAELILQRILAIKAPQHQSVQAQKFYFSHLWSMTYTVETPASLMKADSLVKTKITGLKSSQGRRSSLWGPRQSALGSGGGGLIADNFDFSFNAVVNQAAMHEHGVGPDIFAVNLDAVFTRQGSLVSLHGSGMFYNSEFRLEKASGPSKVLAPIAFADHLEPNFGGNIELISEFKQKKAEIKRSHLEYVSQHPEIKEIMRDYLQQLLIKKPKDVYAYTKTWLTTPEGEEK